MGLMIKDWKELTDLTGSQELVVERVRVVKKDIVLEGEFELPPLARLASEDQVFVATFVKAHGSIKEMERLFGVSYPTIKNRLSRIGNLFPFAEVNPAPSQTDVLSQLEQGEITASEAIERLGK